MCAHTDICKFDHPEENCENQRCNNKKCPKRHKRSCKFGDKCKRRESCEFSHKEIRDHREVPNLRAQIDLLKATVAGMSGKISDLEKVIRILKTPVIDDNEVESNIPSESFKCDKCEYSCKKEVTLRKHIS